MLLTTLIFCPSLDSDILGNLLDKYKSTRVPPMNYVNFTPHLKFHFNATPNSLTFDLTYKLYSFDTLEVLVPSSSSWSSGLGWVAFERNGVWPIFLLYVPTSPQLIQRPHTPNSFKTLYFDSRSELRCLLLVEKGKIANTRMVIFNLS